MADPESGYAPLNLRLRLSVNGLKAARRLCGRARLNLNLNLIDILIKVPYFGSTQHIAPNMKEELEKALEEHHCRQLEQRCLEHLEEHLAATRQQLTHLEEVVASLRRRPGPSPEGSLSHLFRLVLDEPGGGSGFAGQRRLEAIVLCEALRRELELMEAARVALRTDLAGQHSDEVRFNEMLIQYQRHLLRSHQAADEEMLHLERRRVGLLWHRRCLSEGLEEGARTLQTLRTLEEYLLEVGDWGAPSPTVRADQPAAIDRAGRLAPEAALQLRRFADRLSVVFDRNAHRIALYTRELNRFLRLFFDHLITDWLVQGKVVNTLAYVRITQDRLRRLLLALRAEGRQTEQAIRDIENQQGQFVREN